MVHYTSRSHGTRVEEAGRCEVRLERSEEGWKVADHDLDLEEVQGDLAAEARREGTLEGVALVLLLTCPITVPALLILVLAIWLVRRSRRRRPPGGDVAGDAGHG